MSLGIFNNAQLAGHAYDTALFTLQQYHKKKLAGTTKIGPPRFNFKPVFLPTEAVNGDLNVVGQRLSLIGTDCTIRHDAGCNANLASSIGTSEVTYNASTAHVSEHSNGGSAASYSEKVKASYAACGSAPRSLSAATSSRQTVGRKTLRDDIQIVPPDLVHSTPRKIVKTSEFRGVKFCKKSKKYVASIQVNGKAQRLGMFNE